MPLNTTTLNSANITPTATLNGTAGNDTLSGSAADDLLNGLAGADQLFGLDGNDTLDGGAGNDFMNGGLGNDTYLFGRGDGRDIVYMTEVRPLTEVNTLRLKEGVLPSDLSFDMSGTSMLINIIGTTDQFRVDGFLYGNSTTNSANPLQQIVFADGTTWNLAEIQARLYAGTEGADVRGGTYLADAITGLGGNDVLDGKGGDDTIDGGAGADTVIGGLGNDVLLGGASNDNLSGNEGNDKLDGGDGDDLLDGAQGSDTLDGGAGNDYLYGGLDNDVLLGGAASDALYGNDGADTLDGGAGNDTLNGGFGKDVYLFGKGDGQDTISMGMTLDAGRLGTLQFKNGVLPGDIIVTPAPVGYGGIIVKIRDTADQVTIEGFLVQDDPALPYNPVQEFKFADGTSWNLASIQAALYAGSKDADRLDGTIKGELITGQAGNDWIDGKGGNDTIDGGLGNDVINGGVGNDTYLFGKGDGQDEIRAVDDGAPGKLNTLQFKAGIAAGDVILGRYLSDLVITFKGSTDKITVSAFLNGDDIGNAYNPLQQIRFDDGTSWDGAAILARLNATSDGNDTIGGTSGADLINGLGGNDKLEGRGGDDTIDGGSGNDTVNGGTGNDTFLFGRGDGQDKITVYNGAGIDTLQLKPGVLPADVLLEASPYEGLVAKIKGSTDQVSIEQFMPNSDTSRAINALQQIRFADGSAWDLAAIDARIYGGSAGADRVSGTANANTMFGLDGADFLAGKAGNDTIDGGLGNDTINGGGDSDTYLFGRGDGADTILPTYDYSVGKVDVLQFKAGITPADITLATSYSALVININGGTEQVRIESFLGQDDTANAGNPLQEIRFADGTVCNLAKMESLLYAGTNGAEEISGTFKADFITGLGGADMIDGKGGNDTLDGGAGNDTINGGEGSDIYLFGRGDGADTIRSTSDWTVGKVDTLQLKDGVLPGDISLGSSAGALTVKINGAPDTLTVQDFLYQDSTASNANPLQQIRFADGTSWNLAAIEAKLFAGTSGSDLIDGSMNADVINGQDGNDLIDGKAGNDILRGGAGNDQITGGRGSDTYLFGRGDGQDTLVGSSDSTAGKIDTLQFDAGIAGSDLQLSKSGTTLIIKLAGATDQLTVYNFLSQTTTPNPANPLQQIKFADGISWDLAQINAELVADSTPVPAAAPLASMTAFEHDVGLVGVATAAAL
ncbi:calcium-binding protein [Massilia sp. DJPM01]|uniref:calcium-binding protein n=1 Tax=Massilia sp. DJPM01 TaxID=3024404 RepID=UPI00259D6428|nr:calcium-binding protein [Massilia sp. DJPM01]MDM5176140.1 calcium-binding protein [Massilia sp. DJPM01]